MLTSVDALFDGRLDRLRSYCTRSHRTPAAGGHALRSTEGSGVVLDTHPRLDLIGRRNRLCFGPIRAGRRVDHGRRWQRTSPAVSRSRASLRHTDMGAAWTVHHRHMLRANARPKARQSRSAAVRSCLLHGYGLNALLQSVRAQYHASSISSSGTQSDSIFPPRLRTGSRSNETGFKLQTLDLGPHQQLPLGHRYALRPSISLVLDGGANHRAAPRYRPDHSCGTSGAAAGKFPHDRVTVW